MLSGLSLRELGRGSGRLNHHLARRYLNEAQPGCPISLSAPGTAAGSHPATGEDIPPLSPQSPGHAWTGPRAPRRGSWDLELGGGGSPGAQGWGTRTGRRRLKIPARSCHGRFPRGPQDFEGDRSQAPAWGAGVATRGPRPPLPGTHRAACRSAATGEAPHCAPSALRRPPRGGEGPGGDTDRHPEPPQGAAPPPPSPREPGNTPWRSGAQQQGREAGPQRAQTRGPRVLAAPPEGVRQGHPFRRRGVQGSGTSRPPATTWEGDIRHPHPRRALCTPGGEQTPRRRGEVVRNADPQPLVRLPYTCTKPAGRVLGIPKCSASILSVLLQLPGQLLSPLNLLWGVVGEKESGAQAPAGTPRERGRDLGLGGG